MKKVKVIKIDGYDYLLEDSDGNQYEMNIQFYDTKVEVGNLIYISGKVLKEPNIYSYGPIEEKPDDEDIIKIIQGDKEIYLQRYYG